MTKCLIFTILFSFFFFSTAGFSQQNNDAKKLFNEGNAKLKSGDYASAIEKYDAAIKIERHEYFYYQKGLALRKSKKEEQALEAFHETVKINPKFAQGYNALAGGYFTLKDYEKAIENYEKALAENPMLGPAKKGLASAQTARAQELLNKGESEKAVDLTKKAVANDPNLSQAYIILAQAYNKDAKYGDAIQAAEEAIKSIKSGKKGAAYFELGLAYRNQGNMDKAKEAFLEAKKDPTYTRNAEYELKQLK